MRLKYNFEIIEMADEIIAVPVGENADQVHGVLKLNPEGQEILTLLEKEISEDTLVDALSIKHENDRNNLRDYVRAFTAKLAESDLLII